ncbi:MAG: large-conductance mechanosensitive channel protein MscL [Bacteroides sp.]
MGKSTFLQEFKAFAMKGNVVDMAVGVIIGGAFGKIVSSVVADVIMPPIGLLVGGVNFTDLKWVMKDAVAEVKDEAGNVITAAQDAVTLNYGNFLQVTFDFLIIAFSIFMMIKLLTKLTEKKKAEEKATPAPPPAPSKEELLLTEIRDLLKNKK